MARDTRQFAADVANLVNSLGGLKSAAKILDVEAGTIDYWKESGIPVARATAAQRHAGVPRYLDLPPFRFVQGWVAVRIRDGDIYHFPRCAESREPLFAIHGWKRFATEREIRELLCEDQVCR